MDNFNQNTMTIMHGHSCVINISLIVWFQKISILYGGSLGIPRGVGGECQRPKILKESRNLQRGGGGVQTKKNLPWVAWISSEQHIVFSQSL